MGSKNCGRLRLWGNSGAGRTAGDGPAPGWGLSAVRQTGASQLVIGPTGQIITLTNHCLDSSLTDQSQHVVQLNGPAPANERVRYSLRNDRAERAAGSRWPAGDISWSLGSGGWWRLVLWGRVDLVHVAVQSSDEAGRVVGAGDGATGDGCSGASDAGWRSAGGRAADTDGHGGGALPARLRPQVT